MLKTLMLFNENWQKEKNQEANQKVTKQNIYKAEP
jgi:hypothetical protein